MRGNTSGMVGAGLRLSNPVQSTFDTVQFRKHEVQNLQGVRWLSELHSAKNVQAA